MTHFDWDDNEFPLAYLITFRTFGTWLHGDERGSMDRHGKNIYGTERIAPNTEFKSRMRENLDEPEFLLNGKQRSTVEKAIRHVCEFRGYVLIAINVRTNHVHIVISAAAKPETIINAFKSNATRELRAAGLVGKDKSVWSRGGSRRYLWKPHHVEAAVSYVVSGQGDDLPNF
jgi:REP element-mobilizing transposase RayT